MEKGFEIDQKSFTMTKSGAKLSKIIQNGHGR